MKVNLRACYRILRSLLFTIIAVVVFLYVGLYLAMSIPYCQNIIKSEAEKQLSDFLGGKVKIGNLKIAPFNELRLRHVSIYSPRGERCVSVDNLGAGIELWRLITKGKINIVYAEIISLNADIRQSAEGEPLNINFLIEAFKPKEKKTPPPKFDVSIRNIVIRKSNVSFNRDWKPKKSYGTFDVNHIDISGFSADIALPLLTNDRYEVDVRRIALIEKSGLNIKSLSFTSAITPNNLSLNDLKIVMPATDLSVENLILEYDGFRDLTKALTESVHNVRLVGSPFTPSDFAFILPKLSDFPNPYNLQLAASGNIDKIDVKTLKLNADRSALDLDFSGNIYAPASPSKLACDVRKLSVFVPASLLGKCLKVFDANENIQNRIAALQDINLDAKGNFSIGDKVCEGNLSINTGIGDLKAEGRGAWSSAGNINSEAKVSTTSFDVGKLIGKDFLGCASADISIDISGKGKEISGRIDADVPFVEYNGNRLDNITLHAQKQLQDLTLEFVIDDEAASLNSFAEASIAGDDTQIHVDLAINHLQLGQLISASMPGGATVKGNVNADIYGKNPDDMTGNVNMSNLLLSLGGKVLDIDNIKIVGERNADIRLYSIDSDFLKGKLSGNFQPTEMSAAIQNLLHPVIPSFIPLPSATSVSGESEFNMEFTISPDEKLYSFLNTPIRPATDVIVKGEYSEMLQAASVTLEAPYIIRGKNKLIRNTSVALDIQQQKGATLTAHTIFPMKYDELKLNVNANGISDHYNAYIKWEGEKHLENNGNLSMGMDLRRILPGNTLEVEAVIEESHFRLGDSDWNVNRTNASFDGNRLQIDGLRVWHGIEYVDISGKASSDPLDIMSIDLNNIDLSYVFDVLNINYVDFGGFATGKVFASELFTKHPVARTERLFVKNLEYNNCVLGDGNLESHWDNVNKLVVINADIAGNEDSRAKVNGGIYVARDSLSFDFDAKNINVEMLQPFMSGFTSKVSGKASGKVKLYGTFSDIDLGGWAYADPITMHVDYTNVDYTASDTVFFKPCNIVIPELTLRDKYGNTGKLKGEVKHQYLHNPSFHFSLTDARHLLCFDTQRTPDVNWYGHVFADGKAAIYGFPGVVGVDVNMQTAPQSVFTLVLDETQTAADYNFLTFSDRKKQEHIQATRVVTFEEEFYNRLKETLREKPDVFKLNLLLDITPQADVVVIMDPEAGDKMVTNGAGALRMQYSSDNDNFEVYGKYTVEKGSYNFSLQDLILRDFKIKEGSSISFNGDALRGVLDITAAYRVNANLSDLDESFMTDPDLNRTSVPVDAMLKVSGEMQAPDIKFDISLPTVTSEVERKLRSIISTEDMLNRQVVYLLALNRFYTPEYTGAKQGGELASVASSTLSSQISNIISSLTDKISLSPSFKSEKDDFSDIAVDLTLSSSLLNNRLILNGNFGYRDKSTSQTTFIGDFDIEYLLSRDGRLRLKAYNHFNDASYYLKSSLTTQGVGLIYRKEFDNPFTFLRKRKSEKRDSTANEITKEKNTLEKD
ncbi:MAG: translocation/assembly module TamB [Candidatus Amulumruptor caecigallinarius]|nr:translocation/assembly module TamB [Candidatus Amulumruptor caecigallinarius]